MDHRWEGVRFARYNTKYFSRVLFANSFFQKNYSSIFTCVCPAVSKRDILIPFRTFSTVSHATSPSCSFFSLCLGAQAFEHANALSEKLISQPWVVEKSPSLAQMTFTQCTSMSELKFDSVAPSGGQI